MRTGERPSSVTRSVGGLAWTRILRRPYSKRPSQHTAAEDRRRPDCGQNGRCIVRQTESLRGGFALGGGGALARGPLVFFLELLDPSSGVDVFHLSGEIRVRV